MAALLQVDFVLLDTDVLACVVLSMLNETPVTIVAAKCRLPSKLPKG